MFLQGKVNVATTHGTKMVELSREPGVKEKDLPVIATGRYTP